MSLSEAGDTGGEIRWLAYGPLPMMAAARGGASDIDYWRFQWRRIDRLTAIQVGGSLAEYELLESLPKFVLNSKRFFLRKFPKIFPFLIKV